MDTGENFCDLTNEDSATESDMETEEMAKKTTQEPVDLSPEQLMEIAEAKKNEGNTLYKEKKYPEALALYSEAIEMCPKCVAFYGNRAATYMMMGQYTKALEDARQSVQLDPNFVKGHIREGKCHLTMGEAAAAINSYRKAQELEPRNNQVKNELNEANALQQFLEQADDAYSKKDYRKVVYCMDRSLEKSPACRKFKVTKAECLALLKRYQEAQEIANDILRMEETNADAIYVRGLCLYYQDNVEKAFQHFQHVLKFAPDHAKARDIYKRAKQLKKTKEEGNNAFKSGRLQEAYDLYTQALEIDPFNIYVNSKLYFNRATVSSKINKLDQAIKDCTRAIELDEGYLKAYLRRAKCYTDTEQYEEAVRDYEKIYKLDRNRENKKLLQDAKLELKKSKRKDYYKILGVGKDAGENEIKKAYRKRALLHHPDRHANASEEEKKEEEKKFKEIGEAYTILSDSKKKARYDSGQDIDDDGGMEFDPNTIFQTFFGAPAGGGFSFQSSGGHGFSGAGGAGGFPGGFTFQFG